MPTRSIASAPRTAVSSLAGILRAGRRRSRRRSPSTTTVHGLQDRTVGPGPGLPAATRPARRVRPAGPRRRLGRVRPHDRRVREARVRRPRGVLRRSVFVDVPLDHLLSPSTTTSGACSSASRPRVSSGRAADGSRPRRRAGDGRRRRAHAGDTVHLDVADRFGNLVSATPSGGWLQSSPVIPRSDGRSGRGRRCSGSRRPPRIARAGKAASNDALADDRAPRGRAVPGVRDARRRSTGPVVATSSSTTSTEGSTSRHPSTGPTSTPITSRRRSIHGRWSCARCRSRIGSAATCSTSFERGGTTSGRRRLVPRARQCGRARERDAEGRGSPRGMQGYAVGR